MTDASYKHSLGAIRSLGRKGISTVAGSHSNFSMSFCSRYCGEKLIYPNPSDEDRFVLFISDFCRKNKVDMVLPIGYRSTVTVEKGRAELEGVTRLLLPPRESMQIAANKDLTYSMSEKAGVLTPKVYRHKSEVDAFPVVAKPPQETGGMRYVNSPEELSRIPDNFVIQEYIPGDGYGLFALFNKGKPRAVFMHKRIREFPATGGASTAAESVYDEGLKEAGIKLLSSLNWNGVAMAEFKRDRRDGKFKLMEINPKFWGSLDLAIACGVDFPYLAVRMAMDGDIDSVTQYRVGVRFRWPFPDDIMHMVAYPNSAPQILRDTFNKSVLTNLQRDDLLPTAFQAALTGIKLAVWAKRGMPRYPHGVPVVKV